MGNKNVGVMQLFIVMTTAVVSPYAAELIGTYLLIIFAAITGAAWSMGRCTFSGRWQALLYFLRIVCTAILLTIGVTEMMATYMQSLDPIWLVAPVALMIGLIGNDWNRIFSWCFNAVCKIANKVLSKQLEK